MMYYPLCTKSKQRYKVVPNKHLYMRLCEDFLLEQHEVNILLLSNQVYFIGVKVHSQAVCTTSTLTPMKLAAHIHRALAAKYTLID
eukprot:7206-Heterococcus_DN1.PRE.3